MDTNTLRISNIVHKAPITNYVDKQLANVLNTKEG